jgi:hypothetical protein
MFLKGIEIFNGFGNYLKKLMLATPDRLYHFSEPTDRSSSFFAVLRRCLGSIRVHLWIPTPKHGVIIIPSEIYHTLKALQDIASNLSSPSLNFLRTDQPGSLSGVSCNSSQFFIQLIL